MNQTTELAIQCRGLVKRYADLTAVNQLDLEVRRGECFGLLGPNGAGKTTTIEILEGILDADGGDVHVLGRTWSENASELRQRIGVALQETHLPAKLKVVEVVELFRSFYDNGPGVDEVIDSVQLGEKRDAWVSKLSGGQKQRLAVACALTSAPDLLFLDEPTTGLDPQSRRSLWDLVARFRERGGTTLLTTHYMDEAQQLCDRVAIVDHGKLIALGTPAELIASLGAEHVIEFKIDSGDVIAGFDNLPGVTIAARTSSTESVQGYMNIVAVPMWILSGVFFASDNFPDAMQPLIRILPLTALNDAMRGIMLDGSGIVDVAPMLAVLVAWGIVSFAVTLRIFRWR